MDLHEPVDDVLDSNARTMTVAMMHHYDQALERCMMKWMGEQLGPARGGNTSTRKDEPNDGEWTKKPKKQRRDASGGPGETKRRTGLVFPPTLGECRGVRPHPSGSGQPGRTDLHEPLDDVLDSNDAPL